LRERCFGQFEGHTWTEIETQWPEASQAWRQRVPDWEPQGGESLIRLQARVLTTLNRIAQRHMGEQILVVVHGGVLDILYRAATRLDLQAPRAWELRNTAINRLLWSPEGMSLVGWDDRAHLESGSLDERSA
jgi:probable phosphoglycerate mutase